jgi:hypothetical protein
MRRLPLVIASIPTSRSGTSTFYKLRVAHRATATLNRTMSQSASANSDLEAFPIPPLAQSFPSSTAVRGDVVLYPGVTHESTQALRRLLEENDRRFHIYRKISCE